MERLSTRKKRIIFLGSLFSLENRQDRLERLSRRGLATAVCNLTANPRVQLAAACVLGRAETQDSHPDFVSLRFLTLQTAGKHIYTHPHSLYLSFVLFFLLFSVIFSLEIEALARSVSVQRVLKTGLASLCIRSMTRRPRRHVKNATKPHSTAFCIASMTNFERMLRPSMDEMAELDEMDARAGRKRPRCAGMRATKRFWCKEKQLQLHDPKANMEGVAAIREPRKIRMERHCLPGGHFARALASVDESHENLQNTYSDIWYIYYTVYNILLKHICWYCWFKPKYQRPVKKLWEIHDMYPNP